VKLFAKKKQKKVPMEKTDLGNGNFINELDETSDFSTSDLRNEKREMIDDCNNSVVVIRCQRAINKIKA
jgi:hypothetical protein